MSSELLHPPDDGFVVSTYRQIEQVFNKYNDLAGECICCKALLETLQIRSKGMGLRNCNSSGGPN
jgi:predicted HAD superfamily hydrolase